MKAKFLQFLKDRVAQPAPKTDKEVGIMLHSDTYSDGDQPRNLPQTTWFDRLWRRWELGGVRSVDRLQTRVERIAGFLGRLFKPRRPRIE